MPVRELHIVDDEHIDRPQLFLEGDGCLRLERRHKAIHEFLGCQIGYTPSLRGCTMSDCLQEMGFAQTYRSMNIERIVDRQSARRALRYVLRGCMGKAIGLSDDKAVECQAAIKRRAAEPV